MKTKYYFLSAIAAFALASCTSEDYLGDSSPTLENGVTSDGSIKFGFDMQNVTRGGIYGSAAADLLGSNFYVMGTKGTEAETSPTPTLVFDNYLVHYGVNTAGTTESNTANWEYVGIVPGTTAGCTNNVKTGSYSSQTIKYWDYSAEQYDFFGFSTGNQHAVKDKAIADVGNDEVNITAMSYGTSLATSGVAYTFGVPTVNALKQIYITDITEVTKTNYGKEVQLTFKNLGSKVRVALYETVPGYSVKDVNFYQWDGTTDFATGEGKVKGTTAALISADANGLPTKATIAVYFPSVGTESDSKQDYDKAATTVTPVTTSSTKYQGFGTLHNFAGKEGSEENVAQYLGRSLPNATYAGDVNNDYYQTVFPVSGSSALTLRVDYTLVATDGSGETITVNGAKAVVPSTYTKWLPNYAYTYVFKISDNTNGWTDPSGAEPAGLFPITFDAVVAEVTDANAEQTTITTVATPTITTYQQNHNANTNGDRIGTDEYAIATGKDVYVQVMDNSTTSATLKDDLNGKAPNGGDGTDRSLLYKLSDANATEAMVMDALENRTTELNEADVTGRNGLTLTKNANISATVTQIVNGVDNNPIDVTAGEAARIAITAGGFEAGTYAYVYDYSTIAKTATEIYQPIAVTVGTTPIEGVKYVASTTLGTYDDETSSHYSTAGAPDPDYIYFSITTNGGASKTYSFVSVDGKATIPAGLLKYPVDDLSEGAAEATAQENTFYFTIYKRNTGKYAVKVIKVVSGS
ncbi:MAG: hypothetical protein J6035_01745 [Bacteroidaceae bacterium]|nr:hypothetical protein [Bacteroidaceae bacterium]